MKRLAAVAFCLFSSCAAEDERRTPTRYQPRPANEDGQTPQDTPGPTPQPTPTPRPTPAPTPEPMPAPTPTPDPVPSPEPTPTCPDDTVCVSHFPFSVSADTRDSARSVFSSYGCEPDKNESGREHVYRVTVPSDGWLSAAVYDADGVDVDVHILRALDADACMARGHHHARADVEAGEVWVVVDSWTDSAGDAKEGAYRLDIGFIEPTRGPCDMEIGEMARVNDDGDSLAMPATGPVVLEAHLVTQEEPSPYPSTSTAELADHFALSQATTGFVMHRDQVWAPLEGGTFYGAGISSPSYFPVVDESYYVCMYWRSTSRPARGTRMIMRKPGTNRAVVVAAGYETGPGDLSRIAGTTEEVHYYLETGHLSTLQLGIATDQALRLGPRTCTTP